jgi:peptidyl-prolyl cis-trans isomerase SurA
MTSFMRTTRTRTALGALAATALLTLSACGGGDSDSAGADKDASASPSASESPDADADAAAGATPDVSDVPDVVAEVNGEEVTKDEFVPIYESQYAQAATQAQTTGQAPDEDALKKQVVDNLVDTELLAQEADSRGIEVSDDDIDAELEDLAAQNQLGSADELIAAVEKQGVTEEQARSQVETQLMVEQLAEDEDGPLEPTDKELRTLYAQAKAQAAQSKQKIPAFDKAHDQLVEQATSQKVSEVAQTLVTGLRKDADITINL